MGKKLEKIEEKDFKKCEKELEKIRENVKK